MYIRGTQQWFSSHNIHWKHFLGYPEYFLMGAMKFGKFVTLALATWVCSK